MSKKDDLAYKLLDDLQEELQNSSVKKSPSPLRAVPQPGEKESPAELKKEEKPATLSPEKTKASSKPRKIEERSRPVPQQKSSPEELRDKIMAQESYMASRAGFVGNSSAQAQLLQSESLRVAQERIVNLEEEIQELRESNEALASAGDVLKEKMEQLLFQNEDLSKRVDEGKVQFSDEKRILMTALNESRREKTKLEAQKKELENRLSKEVQNIRGRENALENRIEILKMESSVLQREKDKKILDLQKSIHKLDNNLKLAQRKNEEMQQGMRSLKENFRKTVAVLRATIHGLEGGVAGDATQVVTSEEEES